MDEKEERQISSDGRKKIFSGWTAPGTLLPVPTHDSPAHYRRAPVQQDSLWSRFVAWLRYYSIQFRWDIERRLARLLHRRWGDQL
jgi:hypothetical protein